MRTITHKEVQTHFECVCGYNVVDHEVLQIRWKDFKIAGIRRKIDRSTGKPFLLQLLKGSVCHCNEEN